MKFKKVILPMLVFIVMSNMSICVIASCTKSPIFMGEILDVQKDGKDKSTRLLVEGYIKGCEVYKEQLVAIVNEDTKVITGCECGEKKDDIKFSKGDKVFIVLSDAMTKSIPPQSVAKKIKVSKNPQS